MRKCSKLVRMTVRQSGRIFFTRPVSSSPVMSGRFDSASTASTATLRTMRSASAPLTARVTE